MTTPKTLTTKERSEKYPTLRVRVSQAQFDKAYRCGWPESVKKFINQQTETQQNETKQTTSSDTAAN